MGKYKRFWLFRGDRHYPLGGMNDLLGSFNTLAEAREAFPKKDGGCGWDWWHIIDSETGERYEDCTT